MGTIHRSLGLGLMALVCQALCPVAHAQNIGLVTGLESLRSVERGDPVTGKTEVVVGPIRMKGYQWCYDGTKVAYLIEDAGTSKTSVHVVDMRLSTDIVVSGDLDVAATQWTGDGQRLGLATYDGATQKGALYLASSTGGTPVLVSGTLNPGLTVDYAFSCDGRYLAFGVPSPTDPKRRTFAVTDLTTQQPREIVGLSAVRWSWSPRKQMLALLATPEGGEAAKLYTLTMDGKAPEKVSGVPEEVVDYEWSPNGRHLYFRMIPYPNAGRVCLVDTDTGQSMMVEGTLNVKVFAWSPDGMSFVLKDDDPTAAQPTERLRIGSLTQPLTGESWMVPGSTGVGRYTWSPIGDHLAYIKDYEAFMVDLRTRQTKSIHRILKIETLSFRPDGKQLLAVAGHPKERALVFVLLTPGPGDETKHELLSGAFKCPISFDWSPDGQHILAFAHLSKEESMVLVFDPKNPGAATKMTEHALSGTWYPRP